MPIPTPAGRAPILKPRGFSPLDIAGLQLWLKADGTLWQDSARTTPAVADGDVVGAWDDESGNANHATQGTTANKPLLKLAIQNGKPVVRFDGTDDSLSLSTGLGMLRNVAGASLFAVYSSSTVTDEVAINISVGTTAKAFRVGLFRNRTPRDHVVGVRRLDADAIVNVGGGTLSVGVISIDVGIIDYSNGDIYFYKNGNLLESNLTDLSAGNTSDTDSLAIDIGNITANAGNDLNGDIGEILVYNVALSNSDRQSVESYLSDKYGITLS